MLDDPDQMEEDDRAAADASLASLGELYSLLAEDDMFFGLWRRRCALPETNAALSYEQNGYGVKCPKSFAARILTLGEDHSVRRAPAQAVGQSPGTLHGSPEQSAQWQRAIRRGRVHALGGTLDQVRPYANEEPPPSRARALESARRPLSPLGLAWPGRTPFTAMRLPASCRS